MTFVIDPSVLTSAGVRSGGGMAHGAILLVMLNQQRRERTGRSRVWLLCLLAVIVALDACDASSGSPATRGPTATAVASGGGSSPALGAGAAHVFIIVMENQSPESVLSQPYERRLSQQFALATHYSDVGHPSLPNYLALTSGSTWGIHDDNYHRLPPGDIGTEMSAAGVTWRAYMESMSTGCFDSPYPYALKHNPFAYFGGACPRQVVPLTNLGGDLKGDTPRFVWITPNLCNDDHDCSPAMGDRWLAGVVPQILASTAWQAGGVLFVVWDEADGGADRVAAIVVAPGLLAHESSRAYNHYSLLATIADRLRLPRPGNSASADSLSDLLPRRS